VTHSEVTSGTAHASSEKSGLRASSAREGVVAVVIAAQLHYPVQDATSAFYAVAAVGEWPTELLPPPYERLVRWDLRAERGDPPLGSIACCAPGDRLSAVAALLGTVCRWPWVMPCLRLRRDQRPCQAALDLFSGLRSYVAITEDHDGNRSHTPRELVASVRGRPPPTPSVLAHWVCNRIDHAEALPLLLAQFEEALDGVPSGRVASAATYSRHFTTCGRFTARDWRAVARLSVKLCEGTSSGERAHGLGRRTALHVRKYLEIPSRTATAMLGWEWVLEQAMRVAGYVPLRESARQTLMS